MECIIGEKIECIKCENFKTPIDVRELIMRIVEILGVKEEDFEKLAEGYYLPTNNVMVRCEEKAFENWTDYCIRCYTDF
jgi:hypothetical protein